MLTKRSHLTKDEIRDQLGWDIKPEGACQGEWCLPISIDEGADFEVKARQGTAYATRRRA